jgi:molybdopterin synthase catalytic subunit
MRKKDIIEVTGKTLVPEEIVATVEGKECGAIVIYVGKVRGKSEGRKVIYLEHIVTGEKPAKMLKDIVREIRGRWDVQDIAFSYRKGKIKPNEAAIVIVIDSTHRQEAFAACQYAVDRLKQKVITKEGHEDGEVSVGKKG